MGLVIEPVQGKVEKMYIRLVMMVSMPTGLRGLVASMVMSVRRSGMSGRRVRGELGGSVLDS